MALPEILAKLKKSRAVVGKGDDDNYDYFEVQRFVFLSEDEKNEVVPHLSTGTATRQFDNDPATYTLVIDSAYYFWRKPKPPRPFVFANEGFEWLTYECVVNNPSFRKSNQKVELPLYSVPIDMVDVWVRTGTSKELLNVLTEAFFPDLMYYEVGIASKYTWPWKNVQFQRCPIAAEMGKRPASRGTQVIALSPRVVLPYNPFDNNSTSCALGTELKGAMKQLVDTHKWDMWRTASRSAVVELKRVKARDDAWDAYLKPDVVPWPFAEGTVFRAVAADNVRYKSEVIKSSRLKLADLGSHHVSLKTGVCYVGAEDQSWAKIVRDGKDCIDGNWVVSCLRSDLVADTNLLMKERGYAVSDADDRLIVLTEILTIAERDVRESVAVERTFRDGVQVRDLSPLSTNPVTDRVYVFPGSIPFLAEDGKSLTATPYASHTNPDWCAFWREAWAAGLGRAKALFLVRYGLQHKNPNPQNYLIELRNSGGTLSLPGRIVIRDLQDAALHREAIWAVYGSADPTPTESDARSPLAAAFRDYAAKADHESTEQRLARILQYEFSALEASDLQETGSTDKDFGDPGTRLAWWLFSTGKGMYLKGAGVQRLQAEIGEPAQLAVFNMLAEWGMAHDAAFVQTLEAELGLEIRTIDWTQFPTQDKATEEGAADKVHELLKSELGQAALRVYWKSAWKSVTPSKTLTVHDTDNTSLKWQTVLFESADGSAKWSRATDGEGKILLFDGVPVATKANLHTTSGPKAMILTNTIWKVSR